MKVQFLILAFAAVAVLSISGGTYATEGAGAGNGITACESVGTMDALFGVDDGVPPCGNDPWWQNRHNWPKVPPKPQVQIRSTGVGNGIVIDPFFGDGPGPGLSVGSDCSPALLAAGPAVRVIRGVLKPKTANPKGHADNPPRGKTGPTGSKS